MCYKLFNLKFFVLAILLSGFLDATAQNPDEVFSVDVRKKHAPGTIFRVTKVETDSETNWDPKGEKVYSFDYKSKIKHYSNVYATDDPNFVVWQDSLIEGTIRRSGFNIPDYKYRLGDEPENDWEELQASQHNGQTLATFMIENDSVVDIEDIDAGEQIIEGLVEKYTERELQVEVNQANPNLGGEELWEGKVWEKEIVLRYPYSILMRQTYTITKVTEEDFLIEIEEEMEPLPPHQILHYTTSAPDHVFHYRMFGSGTQSFLVDRETGLFLEWKREREYTGDIVVTDIKRKRYYTQKFEKSVSHVTNHSFVKRGELRDLSLSPEASRISGPDNAR